MLNDKQTLLIEYEFTPSPDAEEQFAQAYELILALILEAIQTEEKAAGETC